MSSALTKTGRKLLNLCPYKHIYAVVKQTIKEGRLPPSAKSGAMITLLGIFCPIFWVALFSGVRGGELLFHAAHSSIVAGIGFVLMIQGLLKDNRKG